MLAIDAVDVTKVYRSASQPAIKDLSLRVEAGKIFTLLGRNGAGRLPLCACARRNYFRLLITISVLGYDAVRQAKHLYVDLISIVPQEGRPLRALTPWDHVYNWLQIRGDSKSAARDKTEAMLRKPEIYGARDVPAMNLSGGMKQRSLSLWRWQLKHSFLDEPTIGLDPVSRRQVWTAIKDWKSKGGSILLTTHYMDEAEMLSDYIVIIDKGMIVAQGTIQEHARSSHRIFE